MSAFSFPFVSSLIRADLLGEIHLTSDPSLVSSAHAGPIFWMETTRDDHGGLSCVSLGIDRALVVFLCPPQALRTKPSARLWTLIAAPSLIAAAVLDLALVQPVRWLIGSGAGCLLRLVVPRSARWWGDHLLNGEG